MGKTFIIAEMSANHNGSKQIGIETIRAAKRAGADAIKLQTYTADTITLDNDKMEFMADSTSVWAGMRLYDLYKQAYTPWEWHEELFRVAKEEGLICFSSPFDKTAVDFLESLGNPIYKIASFEITDIPLMLLSAVLLTLPMFLIVIVCKGKTIGGADVKLSAACAFLLGITKSLFGLITGLTLGIIVNLIIQIRKDKAEGFPLIPYLAAGFMAAYFI